MALPSITQQPATVTAIEGASATFSVFLSHMIGASFQWLRNGTNVPGGTNNSITVGPLSLAESGNTFSCFIANAYGSTNSTVATLIVQADTTPPTVLTVGNVGDPQSIFVVFSDSLEPASATNAANYTINNGISVSRAAFGPDARTIVLTTSVITPNVTNILTINNVQRSRFDSQPDSGQHPAHVLHLEPPN